MQAWRKTLLQEATQDLEARKMQQFSMMLKFKGEIITSIYKDSEEI